MFSREMRPYLIGGVAVIFTVVAILITVGIYGYYDKKDDVLGEAAKSLQSIAEYKEDLINHWIEERLADVDALTSNTHLSEQVYRLYQNPNDQESKDFIASRFNAYVIHKKYESLLLINTNGLVLIALPTQDTAVDSATLHQVNIVKNSSQAVMGNPYWCKVHQEIHWDVIKPIFRDATKDKEPYAIIVFRPAYDHFVGSQVSDIPYKSETAEAVVVALQGDSLSFLSDSRFEPGSALNKHVPLSRENGIATMFSSALGIANQVVDYRNQKVLCVVRPIHGNNRFVMVKQDLEEVLLPLDEYLQKIAIIFSLVMLLVISTSTMAILNIRKRRLLERIKDQLDRQALYKHYEYIVRYANDIIYLCDFNNHIVAYNDSALTFYGYDAKEFTEIDAVILIETEVWKEHKQKYSKEQYARGLIVESKHVKKSGEIVPVEVSIRAIEVDNQNYFQCIVRDIRERKHAEETQRTLHNKIRELNRNLEQRVMERTKQLDHAYQELESFSYSVSHDLKAPIRSIQGFSNALIEDVFDLIPESAQDYLQRIIKACGDMNALIDSLLEISKVSGVQLMLYRNNISDLIDEILQELGERYPERRIRLIPYPRIFLLTDYTLMRICLQNILSNALKFSDVREECVIRIAFEETKEHFIISIEDNGIGFDMKYHERLFTPFQRLHSVKEYHGTGIGLCIVKRIMQKHHGDVRMESETNRGTTVYLEFNKEKV